MKNDPYIKEAANKAENHSVRCSFSLHVHIVPSVVRIEE